MSELDRRDFLKLVGVGAGAAAAAGCSDPIEKLVPYVIQPEEITPGIAVDYASTCTECPARCGLHVRTREGRPVKLEGNPDHPINRGRLCARGQASIGRTYSPDRYEGPQQRSAKGASLEPTSWEDAKAKLVAKVRGARGKLRVLGADRGPTLNRLIDGFVSGVGGRRTYYEAFNDEALRAATGMVFGSAVRPVFDLSHVDLIVDFGSSFLDAGPSPVENTAQFSEARDVAKHGGGGAKLVSIAPRLSMTGSKGEQWIPAKGGSEGGLALALAKEVFATTHGANVMGNADHVRAAVQRADTNKAVSAAGIDKATFDGLVKKLAAAKNAVALPPGVGATTRGATGDTAAVLLLNAVLGAPGNSLHLPAADTAPAGANMNELKALIADMNAGRIGVLMIHDSNPVYSLPAAAGFAEALAKVDTVVSFSSSRDETSELADLILPDHTPMESWGDAEPRDGVRSIIQPTIRPLLDTQSIGDTLLEVAKDAGVATGTSEGSFRSVLEQGWGPGFRQALSLGGNFRETSYQPAFVAPSAAQVRVKTAELGGSGKFTLVAFPHSFLGDGSGAALPWLQETPDPVTRVAWNTWVELSFASANELGVDFGDVVAVQTANGRVEASVLPRGGIRDDVVALATGQGHEIGHFASMAGDGEPGVARGANVISVLSDGTDEGGGRAWLADKADVTSTGEFRRLALAQWFDNQRGRELAPKVSVADLSGDSHEEQDSHHFEIPFDPSNDADPDSEYRWTMAIDNDKCTGCGACVVACDIENNIPQVGEQQCIMHREMKWIRIDRYNGEGDTEGGEDRRPYPNRERLGEVDVRIAPMLCQHCGAAPCESVCPVIATYHTPDGINGMVYNRCVGTRYCANNCTYKVRRFNYWDYSGNNFPGLMDLMLNPEVTVRGRGVMEKCSFCVQRISNVRQVAKDEGRAIADGEVVTACQQACPATAISFGNSKDSSSEIVTNAGQDVRAYHALHSLNTRPAITYLANVGREEGAGGGHGKQDSHDSHNKGSH